MVYYLLLIVFTCFTHFLFHFKNHNILVKCIYLTDMGKRRKPLIPAMGKL